MTEPNHTTQTDAAGGAGQAIWPALPSEPGEATGNAPSADSAVGALLERLGEVPDLPVALHVEVYAGLHDELLAALNEAVGGAAGSPAAAIHAAGMQNPPGTTTETEDATHEQA